MTSAPRLSPGDRVVPVAPEVRLEEKMEKQKLNEARADLSLKQQRLMRVMAEIRFAGNEMRALNQEESGLYTQAFMQFLQAQTLVHELEIVALKERIARLERDRQE